GTNPAATGASFTVDGQLMLATASPEFQARIASASEAERITIYRDTAIDFITHHPADAARLYALKLKAFFWASDLTGRAYPPAWPVGYGVWYGTLLVCAVPGIWLSRRDQDAWSVVVLLLCCLVLIGATQAVFYVEGRHRVAVEPLLAVLSAIGIVRLSMTD